MTHNVPMECVSLLVNLFSFYYGSLLNSFLHEAKDPHLAAHPRDSPETWDMTLLWCPIFSCNRRQAGRKEGRKEGREKREEEREKGRKEYIIAGILIFAKKNDI